jgi:hypothetical protein
MNKLITAGVLVAMLTSPAFAQKSHKHSTKINPAAASAYARAPQPQSSAPMVDNGFAGDAKGQIIWGGKVRGQDPDWFVRSQIERGLGNYGAD